MIETVERLKASLRGLAITAGAQSSMRRLIEWTKRWLIGRANQSRSPIPVVELLQQRQPVREITHETARSCRLIFGDGVDEPWIRAVLIAVTLQT